MDEKNIALLGFISGAADYLKDKIDEDSQEIKEIGEIDLGKIKDELSKKLGSSFKSIDNSKDDLITAGREVFDDFISSNSMIDDFKDIFNVDFKQKNEQKDEHIINHLMEILNEPQKEETNEYEQIIASATSDLNKQEEENNKEVEIFKDDKQDEEIDSLFSEIVAHENGDEDIKEETLDDIFEDYEVAKETKEEKEDVLTSSEFKKILEDVLGNALSKLTGTIVSEDKKIEEEIVETKKEEPEVKEEVVEEVKEEPITSEIDVDEILKQDSSKEENVHYEMDSDGVLRKVSDEKEVIDVDEELNEPKEVIETEEIAQEPEEVIEETTIEEEPIEEEPKEFLDFLESADLSDEQRQEIKGILDSLSDIDEENDTTDDLDGFDKNDDYEIVEEPKEIIEETVEETPEEVLSDDQRDFLENAYIEDYNNRSLEDLYISNPGTDLVSEEVETKEESLPTKEEVEDLDREVTYDELENKDEEECFVDEYISNLMEDLSKKSPTDKVEEELRQQEEARNKVYESIKSIYPYLSNGFIKGVYDLKDSLSNEYKDGEKIIILHRLRFEELEGLRRFVEVIMSHDYLVNVDEKQMIVDTFKEHINSDGKILTDIFEVANQAKLLTGEYEGYRILKDEAEASL